VAVGGAHDLVQRALLIVVQAGDGVHPAQSVGQEALRKVKLATAQDVVFLPGNLLGMVESLLKRVVVGDHRVRCKCGGAHDGACPFVWSGPQQGPGACSSVVRLDGRASPAVDAAGAPAVSGVQVVNWFASGMRFGRSGLSRLCVAAEPFVSATLGSARRFIVPGRVPGRVLCHEFRNSSEIP
jgi:hypothetical protein